MSKSRREFLTLSSLGALAAAASFRAQAQNLSTLPPGAPTAFGAGPAFGPEVSVTTFAEAEKLVQFPLRDDERTMAAATWRRTLASLYERRVGPRKLALESTVAPATRWDPMIAGISPIGRGDRFVRSNAADASLPARDEDIAFATVTRLSRWIESTQAQFGAADAHLSGAAGEVQSRSCAAPSHITRDHALKQAQASGCRDRGRANIAGRCMEFRGARRTCSIRRASRRLMARNRFAIAFREKMRRW